jgi:hypothetical protein
MDDDSRTKVLGCVQQMEGYLQSLTNEFRAEYKPIADKQRAYEARVSAELKRQGPDAKMDLDEGFPNEAWDDIAQLPQLCDFIGLESPTDSGEQIDVKRYVWAFCKPLNRATRILRGELYRIYDRDPAKTTRRGRKSRHCVFSLCRRSATHDPRKPD